jgi:hypothetical protein
VVARPLVQGAQATEAAVAAGVHTVALLAGATVTASALVVLRLVAGPAPVPVVAAVCIAAALATVAGVRIPTSRWMVPREWARFGTTGHAALFGFSLGTGVATLLPSAAMYALLVAAESAPSPSRSYALVLTFAAARALMVPFLTVRSAFLGKHPAVGIDDLRDGMARLGVIEVVLLVALATASLLR